MEEKNAVQNRLLVHLAETAKLGKELLIVVDAELFSRKTRNLPASC